MIVIRRLVIHGLVQGVGYRYSMIAAARKIGITGWVRNRRDGTVEAVVQGPASAVDQITQWARRGPSGASVSQIVTFEDVGSESFEDFTQRPTA